MLETVVSWKLRVSISQQSELVASDTIARIHETLNGHYRMLELFIGNIQHDIRRITGSLCKMPGVRTGIMAVHESQLKTILEATAATEGIDFAMLLDVDGELMASFPSDLNAFEVEKYVTSWDLGADLQRVLQGEATDAADVLWDTISTHDSHGLKVFGLDDRDIAGKGAVSITSAGIIEDDFGDPLGICVVGKLLNGYDTPLKQVYDITGSASVIYLDTYPIAQAGFTNAGKGEFDIATLRISPEVQAEVYNTDESKEIVLSLAGQPYLSRCSALKSSGGEKIGLICTGVAESQVTEVQQAIVSYGIDTKQSVQIWILGIGVLSLILFAIVSLVIAARITRPIKRLSNIADIVATGDLRQEIAVTSNDEIGHLANAFRKLLKANHAVTQLAEAIAGGDLTLRINARSEQDTLMYALSRMVKNLNSLVSQIQHTGVNISSSATELAATAKEQETIMAHQVESTHQVVTFINEMSDVTRGLVHTMQGLASVSDTLDAEGQGELADLARMKTAMHNMEDASESISNRLQTITDETNDITSVITTITRVADQTNLLSLNAAIEAEKAGEHGRGFSVVSYEIRRLADQTAVATLDIEQMVQKMQASVASGVAEMDTFMANVRQNVDDVVRISAEMTMIITQVQALSPRFDEVNAAITNLSEEMQQTKDSLHETHFAVTQLNGVARGLQEEVSRFTVS